MKIRSPLRGQEGKVQPLPSAGGVPETNSPRASAECRLQGMHPNLSVRGSPKLSTPFSRRSHLSIATSNKETQITSLFCD